MNRAKWRAQLAFFTAELGGRREGGGDQRYKGGGESHSGTLYLLGHNVITAGAAWAADALLSTVPNLGELQKV